MLQVIKAVWLLLTWISPPFVLPDQDLWIRDVLLDFLPPANNSWWRGWHKTKCFEYDSIMSQGFLRSHGEETHTGGSHVLLTMCSLCRTALPENLNYSSSNWLLGEKPWSDMYKLLTTLAHWSELRSTMISTQSSSLFWKLELDITQSWQFGASSIQIIVFVQRGTFNTGSLHF